MYKAMRQELFDLLDAYQEQDPTCDFMTPEPNHITLARKKLGALNSIIYLDELPHSPEWFKSLEDIIKCYQDYLSEAMKGGV